MALFNDENLSRTDIDVLSLILSLSLKKEYCYASNEYMAKCINLSIRTLNYSLSKLKELKYIILKKENNQRRIYPNLQKIVQPVAYGYAKNCMLEHATSCTHKINIDNKYKNKYNKEQEMIPYWMKHPEICKKKLASKEEQEELKQLLKEFD